MNPENQLDEVGEVLEAARDALVAARDVIEESAGAVYSTNAPAAVVAVSHILNIVESMADEPALLLGGSEEAKLRGGTEYLIRVLENRRTDEGLHYGYLEEAVNLLASLPLRLPKLREESLLLDDERPVASDTISVLDAAAEVVLRRIGPDPHEWAQLGGRRFEELLREIWHGLGWQTVLTPPVRDGGFDIRAIRNENGVWLCYLLEAKAYRPDRPVGIGAVRHLYGVVEREAATHGIIATTSTFTRDAVAEAETLRYRLTLADFKKVLDWLAEYRRLQGPSDA